MALPPCVRKMLSDFRPEYAPTIAGYFRGQRVPQKQVVQALSAYDFPVITEVLRAYNDGNATFSCDFVRSHYPNFCDRAACPLANNFDPVEMAKNLVERAIYVADTGEIILYFRGSGERMVFNYAKALNNTRAFATEFLAKTIMVAHIDLDLRPYRDPDTGEKMDPAFEFLKWLGHSAEKVVNEDAYGIGAVLQAILAEEPIRSESEARHEPDTRLIVKETAGRRYLLVDQQYLRLRLRPVLGAQASPQRANSILASYGVRASVGGNRRYFYAFSPEVLKRLVGKDVDELLGAGDIDALLAKVGNMGGDENEGS